MTDYVEMLKDCFLKAEAGKQFKINRLYRSLHYLILENCEREISLRRNISYGHVEFTVGQLVIRLQYMPYISARCRHMESIKWQRSLSLQPSKPMELIMWVKYQVNNPTHPCGYEQEQQSSSQDPGKTS